LVVVVVVVVAAAAAVVDLTLILVIKRKKEYLKNYLFGLCWLETYLWSLGASSHRRVFFHVQ